MSQVCLLSAAPDASLEDGKAHQDLERMRNAARVDRFGVHDVVDDPADADLIVFVETSWLAGYYFEHVRRHPVYREYEAKCCLFASTDKVVPFLPGVFASVERRWSWPAWTRSGFYLSVGERGAFRYEPGILPSLLFSFVGAANTHRVRGRVMALEHPGAMLLDTQDGAGGADPATAAQGYRERYVESVRDSAFVLCPRGGGSSTFRLFEAMMLGRPPVVISDAWAPPKGPDWASFSIRVAERDVGDIPALLESHSERAAEMGEAARREWLEWFAPPVAFHRTVEWCLERQAVARSRSGPRRFGPHLQMLRPYHAARYLAKRLGHGRGAEA